MMANPLKTNETADRIRALVEDALKDQGVSGRRASLDVVGHDGLIRDIRAGRLPGVDKLEALFRYLGIAFQMGPVNAQKSVAPVFQAQNHAAPTAFELSEPDALPFQHAERPSGPDNIARAHGATRPGIDLWRVKSASMVMAGMLPGDFFLLDTHQHDRCQAGDVVVAQVYSGDTATTVLRRLDPPVLVAASANPADARVLLLGPDVKIMGKVIASWR